MQENLKSGKGRLYPGVEEMLDALCAEGYLPAMLSNCGNHHAQVQWEIYGLDRWFTVFFACETWNGIPKHEILKDIAADFRGALAKSPVKRCGSENAEEQYRICAYVGDRDSDLAAAKAVNVPFIGCRYGYGSPEELKDSTAFAWKPSEVTERIQETI
ncbi:MAG: HAD family hydrolase, partial [Eubacterium sp.]|nr:HAD family hydrolase [Eubacterium sp.]